MEQKKCKDGCIYFQITEEDHYPCVWYKYNCGYTAGALVEVPKERIACSCFIKEKP